MKIKAMMRTIALKQHPFQHQRQIIKQKKDGSKIQNDNMKYSMTTATLNTKKWQWAIYQVIWWRNLEDWEEKF